MKLSLVLPASLLATACAGASPPPPVVPVSAVPPPEPAPVMTTSGCTSAEASPAPPINVTLTAPTKVVDPMIAAAAKRLPVPEQTALVSQPASLRLIDGKQRLQGKNGSASIEVTLPALTTQCELAITTAIQTQRPVEIRGKGRMLNDNVPGHGYVVAWDLEDVSTCVTR